MKTLRKLAAIFCALGMLVPSVAMATFGSTFGGDYTWSVNFFSGNGIWKGPDGGEVLEAFGMTDDSLTGSFSTIGVSTGSDGWSSVGTFPVREGDVIKDLWCMTGHPLTGADASTEVIFATWVIPTGVANGSDVGSQLGTDWVFCTGGTCDTTVIGESTVTANRDGSIVNSRVGSNGQLIFGFKSYTAGGASMTINPVNCTLVMGRG